MCSARVCVCVCGGGGARVHSLDGCEKNSKVSKGVVFVFVFFWRGEPEVKNHPLTDLGAMK